MVAGKRQEDSVPGWYTPTTTCRDSVQSWVSRASLYTHHETMCNLLGYDSLQRIAWSRFLRASALKIPLFMSANKSVVVNSTQTKTLMHMCRSIPQHYIVHSLPRLCLLPSASSSSLVATDVMPHQNHLVGAWTCSFGSYPR